MLCVWHGELILSACEQVKRKVEKYTNPWLHLKFQYGNAKGKAFTEEEDRFIVCMTHQLGYGRWEELKYEVSPALGRARRR